MHVVEQRARAQVVMDTAERPNAVPVDLRYDPRACSRSIHLHFPGVGGHEWAFARELLEQGLITPATSGGIRIWPCGRVQTVVELRCPLGVFLVGFDSSVLSRFLERTYAAADAAAPR